MQRKEEEETKGRPWGVKQKLQPWVTGDTCFTGQSVRVNQPSVSHWSIRDSIGDWPTDSCWSEPTDKKSSSACAQACVCVYWHAHGELLRWAKGTLAITHTHLEMCVIIQSKVCIAVKRREYTVLLILYTAPPIFSRLRCFPFIRWATVMDSTTASLQSYLE